MAAMIGISELKDRRERFGGDKRAINRHSVRVYECAGQTFTLDRVNDACPPYFTLGQDSTGKTLPVNGERLWGDGWSWGKAEDAAMIVIYQAANK